MAVISGMSPGRCCLMRDVGRGSRAHVAVDMDLMIFETSSSLAGAKTSVVGGREVLEVVPHQVLHQRRHVEDYPRRT